MKVDPPIPSLIAVLRQEYDARALKPKRSAKIVRDLGRNVLVNFEAVHLFIEPGDTRDGTTGKVVFVGDVRLCGAIGVEVRVARGTAVEVEPGGGA